MMTSAPAADLAPEVELAVDEQRIRDLWDRLARAWSVADPFGVAAAWDVEADHRRIGAAPRPEARGRHELERALAAAFLRRGGRRRQLSCRIGSIRFLRSDVAIVDGVLQVSASGSSRPVLTEPLAAVMTKNGDEWLIAASRVTAPHPAGDQRSPRQAS